MTSDIDRLNFLFYDIIFRDNKIGIFYRIDTRNIHITSYGSCLFPASGKPVSAQRKSSFKIFGKISICGNQEISVELTNPVLVKIDPAIPISTSWGSYIVLLSLAFRISIISYACHYTQPVCHFIISWYQSYQPVSTIFTWHFIHSPIRICRRRSPIAHTPIWIFIVF